MDLSGWAGEGRGRSQVEGILIRTFLLLEGRKHNQKKYAVTLEVDIPREVGTHLKPAGLTELVVMGRSRDWNVLLFRLLSRTIQGDPPPQRRIIPLTTSDYRL